MILIFGLLTLAQSVMLVLAFIIGGLYYISTNKKSGLYNFNSGVASGQKLLSLEKVDRSSLHGCSAAGISSCHRATVDLGLLKNSPSIELEEVQLEAVRRTNKSVVFQVSCAVCLHTMQAPGAEAVFAWRGEHVAGQLVTWDQVWVLEGCGEGCHMWARQVTPFLCTDTGRQLDGREAFEAAKGNSDSVSRMAEA